MRLLVVSTILLLLLIAVLFVAMFLFAQTLPSMGPFRLDIGFTESDVFSGTVYDVESGRGVPGQIVYLRTGGRNLWRGGGMMHQSYLDTTDAYGRFRIDYKRLPASIEGAVVSRTHTPMQLRSFPPEPVAIPVSPLDEDADEVVVAFLGIQKMAVTDTVFLDLGAISTRMSADSADVAVTVVDDIEPRLVVTALGSGGVVRRDMGLPTSAVDSLCLLCRAPEDGYRMRDTTASPADRSLYFVRLADGRRYARMSLSVQAQLQNLEREGRLTTGGPVWVNRAGGRGLCGPDPYIIGPLFFADKSIREMLRGRVERTRDEGRATPDHAKN